MASMRTVIEFSPLNATPMLVHRSFPESGSFTTVFTRKSGTCPFIFFNTSFLSETSAGFIKKVTGESKRKLIWQKLDNNSMSWVYGIGVNTAQDFVWANVSHLSFYAIGAGTQNREIQMIAGWNLISLSLAA